MAQASIWREAKAAAASVGSTNFTVTSSRRTPASSRAP